MEFTPAREMGLGVFLSLFFLFIGRRAGFFRMPAHVLQAPRLAVQVVLGAFCVLLAVVLLVYPMLVSVAMFPENSQPTIVGDADDWQLMPPPFDATLSTNTQLMIEGEAPLRHFTPL